MKNAVIILVAVFVITILTGLGMIFSGAISVAATSEEPALMRWVMENTRKASVSSAAKSINVRELSMDKKQLENGFRSYREMCAICHTPPGMEESPTAKGLNPKPTDLTKMPADKPVNELFWVIKNGIKMTAMPAWGPTHKDDELWDIVSFVKSLPDMTTEAYAELDRTAAPGHGHAGGHEHGGIDMHSNSEGGEKSAGHDNSDGHHDKESAKQKPQKKKAHDNSDGHTH